MVVININGVGEDSCCCESRLEHWKAITGQPMLFYCAETHCVQPPAVGTRVQPVGGTSNQQYIVPLCRAHDALHGQSLTIGDAVPLALMACHNR